MNVKAELLSIFNRLDTLMNPIYNGDIVFMIKKNGTKKPMTQAEFATLYGDFKSMQAKVEAI